MPRSSTLRLTFASLLMLATAGCASTSATTTTTQPTASANTGEHTAMTPKDTATQAVQAIFVDFDVERARALLAEDYIQHNTAVPTGAAHPLPCRRQPSTSSISCGSSSAREDPHTTCRAL